jgi:hypothetical protein
MVHKMHLKFSTAIQDFKNFPLTSKINLNKSFILYPIDVHYDQAMQLVYFTKFDIIFMANSVSKGALPWTPLGRSPQTLRPPIYRLALRARHACCRPTVRTVDTLLCLLDFFTASESWNLFNRHTWARPQPCIIHCNQPRVHGNSRLA